MTIQAETEQSHSDNQQENYAHSMTLTNLCQSIKNSLWVMHVQGNKKHSKTSIQYTNLKHEKYGIKMVKKKKKERNLSRTFGQHLPSFYFHHIAQDTAQEPFLSLDKLPRISFQHFILCPFYVVNSLHVPLMWFVCLFVTVASSGTSSSFPSRPFSSLRH